MTNDQIRKLFVKPAGGLMAGILAFVIGCWLLGDRSHLKFLNNGFYRVDTYQNGRYSGSQYSTGDKLNAADSRTTTALAWLSCLAGLYLIGKHGHVLLKLLANLPDIQTASRNLPFNIVWFGAGILASAIPLFGVFAVLYYLGYGVFSLSKRQMRCGIVFMTAGFLMLGVALVSNHYAFPND